MHWARIKIVTGSLQHCRDGRDCILNTYITCQASVMIVPVVNLCNADSGHWSLSIASYSGIVTAVFVTCIPGHRVNVWRSGTFLLHSCAAAFWTQEMLPRVPDVEHSVAPWSVFAIGMKLTYLQLFWECAPLPHIHPLSRYITACDQFCQAFPRISSASDKCWAEKAWVQG